MASSSSGGSYLLPACRELLESHPDSLPIREQVEALAANMPDKPGVVVSFCKTIIEMTCKTILTDRGVQIDGGWEIPKLVTETLRYVNLGPRDDGSVDSELRRGAESLVRGLHQIVSGVVEIRNTHGSAAHGKDAYEPLLGSHYAEILARATDSIIGLLFKIHMRLAKQTPATRFPYGHHGDFDEFVDSSFGPFEVLDVQLIASEALYKTDYEAYRTALIQYRQDQELLEGYEDGEETTA